MAYGTIKIDTITFTDGGIDKSVAVSGLVQNPTFTGSVTVTGTISGNTVQGQTISGVTITGTTAQFTSGTFTSLTGVTVTGTTANFTSGNFTNISGGTHTITSGVFALGTAASPSISFVSDLNTGIYSPGADQVAISTNGTGRLFVDASGRLGLGTSSPNALLEVAGNSGTTTPTLRISNLFNGTPTELSQTALEFYSGDSSTPAGASVRAKIDVLTNANGGNTDALRFFVPNASGALSEVAQFTNTGRVGIGTASPDNLLHVRAGDVTEAWAANSADAFKIEGSVHGINLTTSTTGFVAFSDANARAQGLIEYLHASDSMQFRTAGSERARIDSSGRLLVGTSSARDALSAVASPFQIEGTGIATAGISVTRSSNNADGPAIWIAKNRGGLGTNATVVDGDELGSINFTGNNGSNQIQGASIKAFADGTVSGGGANDLPGRLVFSTTADGASSPTERMRIT
ncbi:hypothetical protein EBT31_05435, partial [bacterium]|nr:hypothetical protein [bacterium]